MATIELDLGLSGRQVYDLTDDECKHYLDVDLGSVASNYANKCREVLVDGYISSGEIVAVDRVVAPELLPAARHFDEFCNLRRLHCSTPVREKVKAGNAFSLLFKGRQVPGASCNQFQ